jgi:WD40 repeat protein/tRNA A-37 threonylcarbamoyl transferase component Bud32
MPSEPLDPEQERRFEDVLAAYLQAAEAGQAPDPEELLARHPDLAPALRAFFSNRDHFEQAAGPLTPVVQPSPETTWPRDEPHTQPGTPGPCLPGTCVAGYEILDELGRGGMGVVYKARQLALKRTVALKMIRDSALAGSADRARFRQEAEAVARLQHPNIVQVYEVGEHEGTPFFSLEYCPGGSLAGKLQAMPLPPDEAARLAEILARAVHAAHQAHVLHRDLKPANVLLAADGTPKVTDFGLAKRLDEAGQTASGAVVGTPSYMAPEQAAGRTKEVGPAADVYALGAVLYECLAGRPPFRAATALETLRQVLAEEPVPVRRLQPGVPRGLETICHKCLHKEPRKRYASAEALAEDLRRFQAGEPIRARRVRSPERVLKWVRRRPLVAGLLAAVLLVTVVGISAFAWAFDQALQGRADALRGEANTAAEKKKADAALKKADAALKLKEKQWLRAEMLLYLSHIQEADRLLQNGNLSACRAVLQECRWDLRGPEYHYLANQLANRKALSLPLDDKGLSSLALSADGKRLCWGIPGGTVKVWDLEAGKELYTLAPGTLPPGNEGILALSGDGKRLCSGSRYTIKVWDVEAGKEIRTLTLPGPPGGQPPLPGDLGRGVRSLALSGDGKRLVSVHFVAFERLYDAIKVWDVDTGKELRSLPGDTNHVPSLALSGDGKLLYSGHAGGTITVWDLEAGKEARTLAGHKGRVSSLALSGDGKRLVSGSEAGTAYGKEGTIKVWDLSTGKEIRTLPGYVGERGSLALSGDGKWLYAGRWGGTVTEWDLEAGKEARTLAGHKSWVSCLALSGDGRRLCSGSRDGIVKVWDLKTGQEVLTLHTLESAWIGNEADGLCSLALTRDGRRLFSGEVSPVRVPVIKVWNLQARR